MPKILVDLEQKILSAAKEIIATEGYEALSMKSVAKKSKIAVGTIYNYYPDKNAVLAGIVGVDWVALKAELLVKFKSTPTLEECIHLLYDGFLSFSRDHQTLFGYFTTSGNAVYYTSYRNFVGQGAEMLKVLGKQFGFEADEHHYRMAASLFSYSIHYLDTPYQDVEKAILSILRN